MWRKFVEFDRDAIRSGWRRMIWKLQKILGLNANWPVLWTESKLKSLPSQQFIETLTESQQEQLTSIITEVQSSNCYSVKQHRGSFTNASSSAEKIDLIAVRPSDDQILQTLSKKG
ncbi:hypothetical protein WUBG_13965 [Wuchereria bancrofti]|uniref:Uncharacterized protein n=1 Tax=Wuchereria bancrofti TaxID=6293 RepID=J9EIC0_WUCBA|nr:hypothetical protein WUBG_13965 [Wuchereria bancrofti]